MQETRRLEAVEINTGYYRKITGRESSAGKAYIRQKGSGKTDGCEDGPSNLTQIN